MRGRGERVALGLASITPGRKLTSDLVEELARVLGERVVMSYSSPKEAADSDSCCELRFPFGRVLRVEILASSYTSSRGSPY